MYTKLQQLKFDFSYEPRKIAYKEEAKSLIGKDIPKYIEIINKAFSKLEVEASREPSYFRDKNWYSVNMIGFVKGLFRQEFTKNIRIEKYGRCYLDIDGKFKIYFKKLNQYYLPYENETYKGKQLLHQLTSDALDDNCPILYLGYRVDKNWSNLISTHIVYIENGIAVKWRIDLEDEISLQLPIAPEPITSINLDSDFEEILVKPKKRKNIVNE